MKYALLDVDGTTIMVTANSVDELYQKAIDRLGNEIADAGDWFDVIEFVKVRRVSFNTKVFAEEGS